METVQPGVRLSGDTKLAPYVGVGMLIGAAYVAFDILSEARLAHGTLTGALAGVHTVVDRASPLIVGGTFGVIAHYLVLRKKLALAEGMAARAEAFRLRLLKVERDQAVWILVAAVLHELNNPLHALGLLLDEHVTEQDVAGRSDLLERARGHADRACERLAALRTLRGSPEPDLRPVALGQVVLAVVDDARSLAAKDGVSVEVQCDPEVEARADPAYVRTILENLIDNSLCAIRSSGGSRIAIRVVAADGIAVVRMGDDGPPIDVEIRQHLFEPLRSTKTQGLGLGLPIAHALARAMGGDLSLDGTGGKAFLLALPLSGPHDEHAERVG
jgi:signal transduction histidine kinase